ncbi:MAG TPA: hypothetical protein VMC85_17990 [Desulfomonilaceae bacterium]|nr:hypothetical protein [Desulfomonilaceae bacterium]HVN80290.1 hypothetical protein [Terriglobia bacterium]
MNPEQMADWAWSHACEKCQTEGDCEIEECLNAQEVSDFLKRVARFEGRDNSGNAVRGWFVPDQV